MTRRSRFGLSWLMLTLVIVGAAAHGFLTQTAERMRLAGVAFSEGPAFNERGTLPTLRGARQLSDARKSRTAPSGKADDSDTLVASVSARRQGAPPAAFLASDLGRHVATATRATYRPRGPPDLI